MLLAVDVGNTNIVMGIFQGRTLKKTWRLSTNASATEDEFGVFVHAMMSQSGFDLAGMDKVVISSVVPQVMNNLDAFCRRYTAVAPVWVDAKMISGMPVLCTNPKEVGADRLVNAMCAYEKYRTCLIVVDLGTATTFDAVSGKGEFLGGAIAPGLGICGDALYAKASKLPRVELSTPPEAAVGRDTISSIKSGILFGYAGLVDGVVARMKAEMESRPTVIATGGLAAMINRMCRSIDAIEPNLTLEGLRLIGERGW